MSGTVRRAAAFALVGSGALAAPLLGRATAVPFIAVAVLAAFAIQEGPLFELFARPGDRRDRKLYGLAGFALGAGGLAILTMVGLPVPAFAAAVLLLSYGNVAEAVVASRVGNGGDRVDAADEPLPGLDADIARVSGFIVGGIAGGWLAIAATRWLADASQWAPARMLFLVTSGALLAALLRSAFLGRDDAFVMLSVGLLLWLLVDLMLSTSLLAVGLAIVVVGGLGLASYALGTASVPGMLTGTLLGLLTIVLGGFAWFAVLLAFFGVGGLSTKYKYEEKARRGVAEDNEGARGSGNVLGNAAVSLLALLGFAAAPSVGSVPADWFQLAFAGSLAAALADTLSSEIGGVFDRPRLITSMDTVPPGTDGGVTWQGTAAGVVGAAIIAGIALVGFPTVGPALAAILVGGGVVGMFVDSLLGATLEGPVLGNQSVNFLATLGGAIAAAGLAVALGLPA